MEDNQKAPLSLPEDQSQSKKWVPLAVILILAALITSCIVGYILGRNTVPFPAGQLIDMIVLSPDESEKAFYLTGQIVLSDGTPYANGIVQLHSELKETKTDSEGRFAFFQVEKGEHTVSILDESGTVLAERQLKLEETSTRSGVNVNLNADGKYDISTAIDVRLLEIIVEIDKEEGVLYINPDQFTYLTSDGKVVTPTGEARYTEGTVVTPGGTIVTTDGTIITPSSEGRMGIAVITPEERILYPDKTTALSGDITIDDKGRVLLPNGSAISTNGGTVIVGADGVTKSPGAGGVVIYDSNQVIPIGSKQTNGEGQTTAPSAKDNNSTGTAVPGGNDTDGGTNTTAGQSRPSVQPGTSNRPGTPDVSDTPDVPDTPDEPDIPDVEEPTGELPDFGVSWSQGAELDLFADRTGGVGNKIVPGTKGYYPFQLKNGNAFDIDFTLRISEEEFHLPMRFRITEGKDRSHILTDWWSTQEQTSAGSKAVRLPAGESKNYYLEWEWPYESGNDADDTKAGTGLKTAYRVELSIRAEQVIRRQEYSGKTVGKQ